MSADEPNGCVVLGAQCPRVCILALKHSPFAFPCAASGLACASVLSSGVSPCVPAIEPTRPDFLDLVTLLCYHPYDKGTKS